MAIFESISAKKTLSDTNTCLIKCLCLLVSHFATNPAISVFQFSPNSEGSFFNAQGEEVLNDDEMVQLESDALDDKPKLRFDS